VTKLWKHRLRWIFTLAGLGLGAFLLTAWLTFQHVPDWYRPVALAPDQVKAAQDDLIETFYGESGRSFNQILAHAAGPFQYRLAQDQLNRWLAVREEVWPLSRKWLPSSLTDPVIVLEKGAVRIAATYRGAGGLQTVVSARINLSGGPDRVHVQLADVSGGSLPIPGSWLKEALAAVDRRAWPAGRSSHLQYRNEPLPPLSNLPDGIDLPNTWRWKVYDGDIPFAITDVKVEPGAMTLTVQRLPQLPERRRRDHDASGFLVN
jgi:hypothetical protein